MYALIFLCKGYWREGFLILQQAINWAILESLAPSSTLHEDVDIFMQRFPYPPYDKDIFVQVIQERVSSTVHKFFNSFLF